MSHVKKGFTLIELLIVIAIIAILFAIVFVALNPLQRFQDSRDSSRWADVSALLDAIKIDQVDNGGQYLTAIKNMTADNVYMIGLDTSGCHTYNLNCDTAVTDSTSCIDLTDLVDEGYIGEVPVSPNGEGEWTDGHTGYTMTRVAEGYITVRACESENSNEIKLTR